MSRQQLATEIIEVLRAANCSLTVREILSRLPRSVQATKSEVNSVLYGELASGGLAQRDETFRWTAITSPASAHANQTTATIASAARQSSSATASIGNPGTTLQTFAPNGSAEQPNQSAAKPIFSDDEFASIEAAVREEIAAANETTRTEWLDIDAIEHLPDSPGKFVYQLILSTPVHFSADQAVTFQTRHPKDTIPAVIIRSDDQGLVVECEKPLPTDAKLLSMSFDPVFILRALEDFVVQLAAKGGPIARLFATKTLPIPPAVRPKQYAGLNEDQALAIGEMSQTPFHLLWGPPGTGKTTTVGAAVVEWMRQGKSVLVVSTSNAAVDVAMKAVLKRATPTEKQKLLRLGTSLDPEVRQITCGGKLAAKKGPLAGMALIAQHCLREIRERVASRNLPHEKLHSLFAEAAKYEKQIADFNEQAAQEEPELTSGVLVTGCTLAKMVLDKDHRNRHFDVVIVDEASMASLLYAFAASLLASSHLVYAGDPKQLPPIVQAEGRNAAKWFGQNVYDWFGVEMGDDVAATKLSLLRTQYRMTDQIGGTVSRLSYGSLLKHGRRDSGPLIEFIDIDGDWQTTHYSVQDKSYYHLAAIPILHALSDLINPDELLLLSPFRPQRSLLAALAFDLKRQGNGRKTFASTIHRSQGSESAAVVVDLTTHSPQQLVAFFRDKHSAKLFNVAISRAKDHLIILGSQSMIRELSKTMPFWRRVISELAEGMDLMSCSEVIDDINAFDHISSIRLDGTKSLPALYCHSRESRSWEPGVELLKGITASRKLLVLPDAISEVGGGDFILRRSTNCPPLFIGGGRVCLPYQGKWLVVDSPNVSRVLWRIGFSHLADDEVDPIQAKRFFCPDCSNGELNLRQYRGEGWFLVCSNGQVHECYYRRRLSLEDAKLKVRLQGMRCPEGHPLTARQGSRSMFIGCENYPECEFNESLSILDGV